MILSALRCLHAAVSAFGLSRSSPESQPGESVRKMLSGIVLRSRCPEPENQWAESPYEIFRGSHSQARNLVSKIGSLTFMWKGLSSRWVEGRG
jgi:hypothetical protein